MADEAAIRGLLERDRVAQVINTLFTATDAREWQRVRSCYRRTRSGRNTRVFVGSYDFHLRLEEGAWKIDSFRFKMKFVDGNAALESEPGA